eukprot:511457-Pyramimonas_sp.AAC.1
MQSCIGASVAAAGGALLQPAEAAVSNDRGGSVVPGAGEARMSPSRRWLEIATPPPALQVLHGAWAAKPHV